MNGQWLLGGRAVTECLNLDTRLGMSCVAQCCTFEKRLNCRSVLFLPATAMLLGGSLKREERNRKEVLKVRMKGRLQLSSELCWRRDTNVCLALEKKTTPSLAQPRTHCRYGHCDTLGTELHPENCNERYLCPVYCAAESTLYNLSHALQKLSAMVENSWHDVRVQIQIVFQKYYCDTLAQLCVKWAE